MTILQTKIQVRVFVAVSFFFAAAIGAYVLIPNNFDPCPCEAVGTINEDFSSYEHQELPDNIEIVRSEGDTAFVYDMNGFKFFSIFSAYVNNGQVGPKTRTDIRYTNIPTTTNYLDVELTAYFGAAYRNAVHVLTDETVSNGYYVVWHDRNVDVPDENIRIYKQSNLNLTLLASSENINELTNSSFTPTPWRVLAEREGNAAVVTVYEKVEEAWVERVSYTDEESPYLSGGVAFSQYEAETTNAFTAWSINYDEIPPAPLVTITSDFERWQGPDVSLGYTLTQPGSAQQFLDLTASTNTGIYYSIDGNNWLEATDAGGDSNGKENLLAGSEGDMYTFVWDADQDLPGIENQTVYLRLRATNESTVGSSWTTSTAFWLDTKAPLASSLLTQIDISSSSVVLAAPSSTDLGSGNNQWILQRGTSTIAIIPSSTQSYTDTELTENTNYIYSVLLVDGVGNISTATGTIEVYTLAKVPKEFAVVDQQREKITLSVQAMPNDTVSSSGYYFENMNTGEQSGWIQTPVWEDTSVQCGNTYEYRVQTRNQQSIETDFYTDMLTSSDCPSSGGVLNGNAGWYYHQPTKEPVFQSSPAASSTEGEDRQEDTEIGGYPEVYCEFSTTIPYKYPDESGVYLLVPSVNGCQKQAFLNESTYFSYFDSWGYIHPLLILKNMDIADPEFVAPPIQSGMLVKELRSPKVYKVVGAAENSLELEHIPSESAFLSAGYRWEDIVVYSMLNF